MPIMPNTEIQARLLQDLIQANARKRRLEEKIRSIDAASNAFIYKAAMQIIEVYKNRRMPTDGF
jgi:hypothetical protein